MAPKSKVAQAWMKQGSSSPEASDNGLGQPIPTTLISQPWATVGHAPNGSYKTTGSAQSEGFPSTDPIRPSGTMRPEQAGHGVPQRPRFVMPERPGLGKPMRPGKGSNKQDG